MTSVLTHLTFLRHVRHQIAHEWRYQRGLVLLEDFGTDRMRDWLDENPGAEEGIYRGAIDALLKWVAER